MADDLSDPPSLYDTDVLAWAEQQASALRARQAGGNALDWDNLAEEIEDVGKSVYRACQSQVDNILTHLLKIEFIGPAETVPHWKGELVGFRTELGRDLTPTVENRLRPRLSREIDYVIKRLRTANQLSPDLATAARLPGYTWEQVVDEDWYPRPRYGEAPPP